MVRFLHKREYKLYYYKMRNLIVALLVVFCFSVGWSQENYSLSSESKLTVDGTSTLHDWTVTANTCNGALVVDCLLYTSDAADEGVEV